MIKNIFKSEKYKETSHDGIDQLDKVRAFEAECFQTKIDFIDYIVIPPGATIGKHTHSENEEIYFILKGNCSMEIEGALTSVTEGDVLVNEMGGTHALVNDSGSPVEIFIFQVSI